MKVVRIGAEDLEERIREIAGLLFDLWETASPTNVSEKCKLFLKRIGEELTRAQSFLTKYENHGKLVKYLSSTAHTEDLKSINGALTQVIADAALLLGVENRVKIVHLEEETHHLNIRMGTIEELLSQIQPGTDVSPSKFMELLKWGHPTIFKNHPEPLRQLEVYVPLRYSLDSPNNKAQSLESMMKALLHGSEEEIVACTGGKKTSIIFVQGVAGTGKSLYGWRSMQFYDELVSSAKKGPLRIPV